MSKSPTDRSKARYARAAAVIAPIALDDDDASKLAALMTAREISAAALVRELIREAFSRIKATRRSRSG